MPIVDLYTMPHKALRSAVHHAGTVLSATDAGRFAGALRSAVHHAGTVLSATDAGRFAGDVAVVTSVLAEVRAHAEHEEEFIHPLVARFVPGALVVLDAEHAGLELALVDLDAALEDLVRAPEPDPAVLLDVHRAFQRFAAHNLVHLDHEEVVVMPALSAAAPARELEDVLARFRATHPEAVAIYRRWPDGLSMAERRLVGAA